MTKFGPSGNSESFFNEGYKTTLQMPKWLKARGLDIFEYSFGRGVNISSSSATEIGNEAKAYGIEMTAHAPYFINFASVEQDKADNSVKYLTSSLKVERCFGGNRVVFHPGAEGKQTRANAFARTKDAFAKALDEIKSLGYDDMYVCPETMGKSAQIGTVAEVIELCQMGDSVLPCVDFGHVNSLLQGALKTTDDYKRIVIEPMLEKLGYDKVNKMHVHFSKIMYGAKGEIKHLTLSDDVYGPEFEPLAKVLHEFNLNPYILSESNGTQAEDAAQMQSIYNALS